MKATRKALAGFLAVLLLMSTLAFAAVPASAADNWETLKSGLDTFKVKETGTNYNKKTLKVGAAVTFDTPLYTLTVKIAAISTIMSSIFTRASSLWMTESAR